MTIVTNIPDSLRGGITYHVFNFLNAAGTLANIALRGALVGTMRSTGTATAGTVYDVTGMQTTDVDAMFGQSSEIAIMYRMGAQCSTLFQRGPRLSAVGLAEPGGGTANVQTLTLTGNASVDGPWQITIAGRPFIASAKANDSPTTQATNMTAIINQIAAQMPVLVTSAAGVITVTHPTKGVNGGDIKITIDKQVPGTAIALATTAAGAGTSDASAAFTSLAPLRYDGIAFGNHDSTLTTEIVADILTRWNASSKTWGYYFLGEPGTTGTATALATAINHQAGVVASIPSCPNTPAEIATAVMMLVCSRPKASASFDKATVPLVAPPTASLLTGTQQETSIGAGLTVFDAVLDSNNAVTANRLACNRLVTTRTTTSGQPDARNRDISVSRTGLALAIQLDIATGIALGADTNPDGVAQDDDTDQLIVDLAANILRAEAAGGVIRKKFLTQDIAGIQVEHDSVTQGRDNTLIPYHAITPLHQIAWVHNVQIGG